jgi:dTDP-4-amino-4,6-dideoxygalactose transaminase
VPVANATAGLMAAIAALVPGLDDGGPGEVLLPSFTFAATIQAAIWSGLQPRLLDVAPDHWHLDPAALENQLARRDRPVSLVLAVTAFGTPPPPEVSARWVAACASADVPLIVDAAAGFGAVAADGVPVGALGDADVVSFHATKPFAIGEGGAVFCRDATVLERIERATNFGLGPDGQATMQRGLNAKMSELHAATALAALDRFDVVLESRRASAADIVGSAGRVAFQAESGRSTWQFVPAAFTDASARSAAAERCRGLIEVRRYYRPLHLMAPFQAFPSGAGGLGVTEDLAARVLCLPMADDLSPGERSAIASILQAS